MKIDSEHVHGNSTLVHNPASKSLDNAVERWGLKSGDEIVREDKHRIASDLKSQNCEVITLSTEKHNEDRLGNFPGLEFMDMDDLINVRENENGDFVRYTVPPCEIELSERETDLYTDKSVTECELPELVACFKEDAFHVVKDICIDEGVPSLDKILIENGRAVDKLSFQPSDLNLNSAVAKETGDCLSPRLDCEMKSVFEHNYSEDFSSQCASKNLLPKDEVNFDAEDEITDVVSDGNVVPDNLLLLQNLNVENSQPVSSNFKGDEGQQWSQLVHQSVSQNVFQEDEGNIDAKDVITHDVSDEKVVPENMLPLQKLDTQNICHVSSSFKGDEGQQRSELVLQSASPNVFLKDEGNIDAKDVITHDVSDEKVVPENMLPLQKLDTENIYLVSSDFDGNESQQQSEQDTSKEAISANSALSSVAEEYSNSKHANKLLFDSKVDSGSITFDFDSPTPATSGSKECPQNADCQQPLQTLPLLELEDGTIDSLTASSRSFFIQHGYGDSSFSAAGPFSGPIAYSGPIPYSGSISLRSDSSTTSTRSFAFPILHSEWNSSPVKMAKADRRHFRKHRGWGLSLLCCRF